LPAALPPDWQQTDGKIASTFIRATKPLTTAQEPVKEAD